MSTKFPNTCTISCDLSWNSTTLSISGRCLSMLGEIIGQAKHHRLRHSERRCDRCIRGDRIWFWPCHSAVKSCHVPVTSFCFYIAECGVFPYSEADFTHLEEFSSHLHTIYYLRCIYYICCSAAALRTNGCSFGHMIFSYTKASPCQINDLFTILITFEYRL